jgi:hypothetical protein
MRAWILALGVLLLTSCSGGGINLTPVALTLTATSTATPSFSATGAAKATRLWEEMSTEAAKPTFSPPTITAITAAKATGRATLPRFRSAGWRTRGARRNRQSVLGPQLQKSEHTFMHIEGTAEYPAGGWERTPARCGI